MIRKLLLTTALTVLAAASVEGRTINIHGTVTEKGTGEPAPGVTIFDNATNKFLGVTGEDGRYRVTTDSESELLFSAMAYADQTVPVKGKLSINVQLVPEDIELAEVTVVGKAEKGALQPEPADLDLDGNILRLKTKVKIPANRFNSSMRMIIQPAVYNVTRKNVTYLTPVVYDGWRYADTQERMLGWDKSKDKLSDYQQVKRDSKNADNTIYLIDSLYIDNPKDDFMGMIISSLEDYNRVVYTDTFEIARGTVNPLRFLSYKLTPMGMKEERYLPTPEVELRDAAGEMNLLFPVGKTKLDLNLGDNNLELNKLLAELQQISNDPDMTLKSFAISGSASPEGRYELNKDLADDRMKSAMETILSKIDPSLRNGADISTNASVASWDDVVALMRADGYNSEADQVQNIINRNSNHENRSYAIARLPFYKSLVEKNYLPRLRRVNYTITSSRYRPLTDEEIAAIYAAKPKGLTKYQYHRLYSTLQGDAREKAIRNALAAHPDYTVAATDLSEILINQGKNKEALEVLNRFIADPQKWNRLPESTRYNAGVGAMGEMRYALADSLLSTISDNAQTHKAKIYASAQNGRYHDVIHDITEDSHLNEVVLLLAIKDNKNAWDQAKTLGNSAVEEYVKAIAANRLNNYSIASVHLENAFKLDPSLRDVAKIDGDVVDLLDNDENDN